MSSSDHFAKPSNQPPTFKRDAEGNKQLLIVNLTELDHSAQQKLINHYQTALEEPAEILTWTPARALLQSFATQGPRVDSQSNLYAIAVLLYQADWTGFIVADELTKRQVTGKCRLGEDHAISVVMIATEATLPSGAGRPGDPPRLRVSARRTNTELGDEKQLGNLSSDWFTQVDKEEDSRDGFFWDTFGMVLHDPDHQILTPDTANSWGRKEYTDSVLTALSAKLLPAELIMDIFSRVEHHKDAVPEMPIWQRPQSLQHIHIFLFFHATPEEIERTHAIIQNAVTKRFKIPSKDTILKCDAPICNCPHLNEEWQERPKDTTVELIPLDRHQIKSRRHIVNFFRQYHLRHLDDSKRTRSMPIYFLLSPLREGDDIDSGEFGYCRSNEPLFTARMTFNKMIDFNPWKTPTIAYYLARGISPDIREIEFLHHPDMPFYHDPPPGRLVNPMETNMTFYLTKHLTTQEDEAIQMELRTDDFGQFNEDFEICRIPWESEEDGTLDDIWNILWTIYRHDGAPPVCFFCIDREAAVDLDVLLVKPDFYWGDRQDGQEHPSLLVDLECPRLRGFWYCRISGNLCHQAKIQLDTDNLDITELGGYDLRKYRRPGWPARGILPLDDDESDRLYG
ncbi:hypothetical protein N7462_011710 [Penicillium macrosclerotiorum]|uniref:uncharacterized protein n=1 Tax=Penicillium macrosclerotiorum TaxID=303699 RepID=UPI0025493178|nr:uncharacterized protein N7462_011710 [Penicillium macrosclerotiorum]KAJ5662784.1 hypothetical protein N7462_011710 [Penicillium macrosclerotiorum]